MEELAIHLANRAIQLPTIADWLGGDRTVDQASLLD